jgi:dGTPase
MLTRLDIEEREVRALAPYATRSKESRGRRHPEPEHPLRGAYQRDRDRIIHCTAFRRLEYKTQVFVNHEGDHYRTRLTHTMEVAQIARTIARMLNVNEDLVEACALAHDLGHTPFGHSGEDALRELMKEHGGFEHNRQGLRVVDVLESRYPAFRGLNLCWEVRESIAKHVTTHDRPQPTLFRDVEFGSGQPSLEAQIVEAADSIAYDTHDLDDGLAAQMVSGEDVESVELGRMAIQHVRSKHPNPDAHLLRTQVVNFVINALVTDLVQNSDKSIRESGAASPGDVRKKTFALVRFSPAVHRLKLELESFLMARVYQHYRVARMSNKAKHFIARLFNAYVSDPRQLPFEYQEWVAREGAYQGVCDYIAGMTDRYAQDDYTRLFQPFERV